jgi:NADP-dependent 3-hydroxy acid dehydrogenase YdfG
MRTLRDKVAVVTGAAGGIGRATALGLAAEGCHIALVDVSADRLEVVAAEVRAFGRRASAHTVDVADRAAMEALPAAVLAAHGQVDVVVNNAGVTVTAGFHEHDLDDFAWVVGVNLWGVVYGCRFFLPHLMRQPEGHIVNVSSLFGVIGVPAQTSYCATKFAVRGFTEALAEELRGTTVGITVVHPGGVATDIMRHARSADPKVRDKLIRFFDKAAIPPEQAAAQIVGAIRSGAPRLRITREAYALDLLKRAFPVWGNQLGVRLLTRTMRFDKEVDEARARAVAEARQKKP